MAPGRPFRITLNPPEVTLKWQGWIQTPSAYGTQRGPSSRLVLVTKCSRLLRFGSRPSVKLLKAVIGKGIPLCEPQVCEAGIDSIQQVLLRFPKCDVASSESGLTSALSGPGAARPARRRRDNGLRACGAPPATFHGPL